MPATQLQSLIGCVAIGLGCDRGTIFCSARINLELPLLAATMAHTVTTSVGMPMPIPTPRPILDSSLRPSPDDALADALGVAPPEVVIGEFVTAGLLVWVGAATTAVFAGPDVDATAP